MAGFEIVSEVSTRETDFDGTRHSAWSDWTSNTAVCTESKRNRFDPSRLVKGKSHRDLCEV
jgi:hypothetical protein